MLLVGTNVDAQRSRIFDSEFLRVKLRVVMCFVLFPFFLENVRGAKTNCKISTANIVRFENVGVGESKRSGRYPLWFVRLEKGVDAFGDGVCCPGAMISQVALVRKSRKSSESAETISSVFQIQVIWMTSPN
jgi:hypothetical protein